MYLRISIAAAALYGLAAQCAAANDIEDGRALAKLHCTRCHVVGDYNKFGGIGSTPSFQLLVNAFDDWRERFDTFHVRRPHLSFVRVKGFPYPDPKAYPPNATPVEINLDDVGAIRAFAETLKKDPE